MVPACGAPGWIRTSTVPLLRRLPLPLDYGRNGRLGRIRTDTGRGLSALPLPGWATSLWCSGRDSNSQPCGSQPHASAKLRHPNIGGQSRIRTLDVSRRVTGATARRFQPLSQLPKRELSKIWRKAGDSNAYVPRDPGLADQWIPITRAFQAQSEIWFTGKLQT